VALFILRGNFTLRGNFVPLRAPPEEDCAGEAGARTAAMCCRSDAANNALKRDDATLRER
jgi:hypothetical protein